MIRAIIIIVIIAGLGLSGWFVYSRIQTGAKEGEAHPLRTNVAEVRSLEEVIEATGEVRPVVETVVKSELSGRIEVLEVEEGDRVQRGDLLLRLDPANLQAQLEESQRDLEAFRLRLARAERNYRRLQSLRERDFGQQSALEDAKTDFELAQIELSIRETRMKDAEDNLSKTEVRAPHDGVVIDLAVNEGSVITGVTTRSDGTDLLKVANFGAMYLSVNINEIDINKLSEGDPVRIGFEALEDTKVEGEITHLAPSAQRVGGRRVFPVDVAFTTTDPRIRPGISGTVTIPIETASEAISVIVSAVFTEGEDTFVFVEREPGSYERRPVEIGINDRTHVEIKRGLQAGEAVTLGRPRGEFEVINAPATLSAGGGNFHD